MAVTEYKTALIVAAHPDDEVAGAGGWAASFVGELAVAFLTNGVPADPRYFAPGYTDAELYRRTRQQEARAAWRRLRPEAKLYFAPFADQSLAFALEPARAWLDDLLRGLAPDTVLAPAFEGGHPDHDAANCLVAAVTARSRAQEYALYSVWRGQFIYNTFPGGPPPTPLTGAVLAAKRRALAAYESQQDTLASIPAAMEALRPLPAHDYGRPARREPCVYERWGWPWRAAAIAARLGAFTIAP